MSQWRISCKTISTMATQHFDSVFCLSFYLHRCTLWNLVRQTRVINRLLSAVCVWFMTTLPKVLPHTKKFHTTKILVWLDNAFNFFLMAGQLQIKLYDDSCWYVIFTQFGYKSHNLCHCNCWLQWHQLWNYRQNSLSIQYKMYVNTFSQYQKSQKRHL